MNTKLTFVELVDLLSESTSTTQRVCELFLRELFSTISQTLIKGRPVTVKGIGEFKVVESGAHSKADSDTKAKSHKRITFTPDKALAAALNEPFAQFNTIILDDAVTDEQLAEIDAKYPPIVFSSDNDEPQPQPETATPAIEEVAQDPKPAQTPEPQAAAPVPAMEPVAEPAAIPVVEPEPAPEPAAPVTDDKHEPEQLKRKPMLIGIPIDGPSQPVPEPEPVEEDVTNRRFYRPEPRNIYTPTPEQIEEVNHKPTPKWWIPLLALVAVGALIWWLNSDSKSGVSDDEQRVVMAADTISDNDSILLAEEKTEKTTKSEQELRAEKIAKALSDEPGEKPDVKPEQKTVQETVQKTTAEKPAATAQRQVTDVVTSQIVLTTLAEKHYGSQWFWVYIYEENKNIISNPNNIRPGTRVVIPPPEKYGINVKDPKSLKKAQRRSWELLK